MIYISVARSAKSFASTALLEPVLLTLSLYWLPFTSPLESLSKFFSGQLNKFFDFQPLALFIAKVSGYVIIRATITIRKIFMDKILKATPAVFVLFGLGACVSEPFARNCVRVLFLIFFAMLWQKKFSLRDLTPYAKILLLMAAFTAWLMISYVWGGMKIPLSDDAIEWVIYNHYMFIFLLVGVMIREEKILTGTLIALGLSLVIDDVYIFYQAAQGVDRPTAFLHGSFMQSAMIYLILLPTFLVMTLKAEENFVMKIFCGLVFLVSLAAFVMINTRGAWLALAIVLAFVIVYRLRTLKKIFVAAVVFVVLGGAFLIASPSTLNRLATFAHATSEQSVSERFLMWRSAFNAISDNPLMGVGFGNYEAQYQNKYILAEAKERSQGHTHNVYLQFWAETGLPGLILFCGLFGYILCWSWRRARNFYGLIIFSATLALLLFGLTDYTIASFSAMRIYWLVFGLCLVGLRLTERKNFSV